MNSIRNVWDSKDGQKVGLIFVAVPHVRTEMRQKGKMRN